MNTVCYYVTYVRFSDPDAIFSDYTCEDKYFETKEAGNAWFRQYVEDGIPGVGSLLYYGKCKRRADGSYTKVTQEVYREPEEDEDEDED